MERDFRLTGQWREQSDNPIAPVGFEVNNPWRVCNFLLNISITAKKCPAGKEDCLILSTCATFNIHTFESTKSIIFCLQDKTTLSLSMQVMTKYWI